MSLLFTLDEDLTRTLETRWEDDESGWINLPDDLREGFKKNRFTLPKQAFVTQVDDQRWRLVAYDAGEPRAYDLVQSESKLKVQRHSESGLSKVLADYPVFHLGLGAEEYADINQEDHGVGVYVWGPFRDGRARQSLAKDQRQRWDYFFPIDRSYVGYPHRRRIHRWTKEKEDNTKALPKKQLYRRISSVSTFVMLGLTGLTSLMGGDLASLAALTTPMGIACLIMAIAVTIDIKNRETQNRERTAWIPLLRREGEELKAQAKDHAPPSDTAYDRWLQQDLAQLNNKVIETLNFESLNSGAGSQEPYSEVALEQNPDNSPLQLPLELNPRGLSGILLESWGLIQSDKARGIKDIHPLHLGAVRVGNDGRLRFGVQFFQFILPTGMQLAVYGSFWDCILRQEKGLLTDEFFYRDIVSLRSRASRVNRYFGSDDGTETMVFSMSVASGESIEVSLTDHNVLDDMTRRLKKRRKEELHQMRKLREEAGDSWEPENGETFTSIEDIDEEGHELTATRAKAALAFIRPLLRKFHQQPVAE